jgi:DUF1680 family protein
MTATSSSRRRLAAVPFTAVSFDDAFWAPKQKINREVTIPHVHQMCTDTNRFSVFELNYTRKPPYKIVEIFGDSDPAKWIEAVGYSLATHPDPELEALADREIDRIVAAQEPSGYLNTHFQAIQPEMKWKNLRDWHEMYCAGHMMEGAVAYYQATGKRKLLDAMMRYADHIAAVFGRGPGQKRGYCGHAEIELALVKLANATGERRYMDLSKYMIDERGQQPHYYDIEARERGDDPAKFWFKNYEYNQSHKPIREQDQAVGHAVRAMYLFSGAADIAHEYDDPTLLEACERIWTAMTSRRMYLTGGIGPSHSNEGFTRDYDLPDENAYAETCAAIGLVLWCGRMLQFRGEGKYADLMERALYNGTLSGVSLDGSYFYYENPLASLGHHHRVPWFECPCCPPNVARTVASVGGYFYSTGAASDTRDLWVHLYGQNAAKVDVGGRAVTVRQETGYPWDGKIAVRVDAGAPTSLTLHLRVPGWCDRWSLKVNGAPIDATATNGYVSVTREWTAQDVLVLDLDMTPQALYSHPSVRQAVGKIAIQRGPLVYCLEGVDNRQVELSRISIDPASVASMQVEHRPDLLGGVTVLRGPAQVVDTNDWDGVLYGNRAPQRTPAEITAVPYYAWDNRPLAGEMRVWLRTN